MVDRPHLERMAVPPRRRQPEMMRATAHEREPAAVRALVEAVAGTEAGLVRVELGTGDALAVALVHTALQQHAGAEEARRHLLPALAPMLLLVSVLSMAGHFQLFAEPYVMTQGGPLGSTQSVLYLMYEQGFKWWNLGSASAVAFVLFFLMFGITRLQLFFARRWEHA